MIKKLPLPIAGVMLGFAALGNLLQSYSETLRSLCGIISLVLGLLLVFKIIAYPSIMKEDMNNPIMAGVFATFPMAIMLLSTYAKPLIGENSIFIWYFGIILHIALIVYFSIKFIFNFNIKKVFTPYFIVYVGLAVSSVSAPIFEKIIIGTLSFWFAFIMCMILLFIVTYRYTKYTEIPTPAQPLFCIYAAPVSLCLAGYIQSVQVKSLLMIGFLAILSLILYIIVLFNLPKYLKMPFFPSYSAFTFPFVISAIGMKMTTSYLIKIGSTIVFLKYFVLVQTVIATILVIYTLFRYILFLIPEKENHSVAQ